MKSYCFFLLSFYWGAATQQYIGGKTINILFYFSYCWYSSSYLGQLSKGSNNFKGNKSQEAGQLIQKRGDECQQLPFRFHGTHPDYLSGPSWAAVEWWEKKPSPKRALWHRDLCAGQQPLNSNNNCSTPTPGISLKGYPIIKQHKFPKRYFYLLVLLIKNLFSKGNHCKLSWEKLPTLPRYFVCCLSPFFRNPHIISSLKTSISFCLPHWKFLILNWLTFRKQPHYKA